MSRQNPINGRVARLILSAFGILLTLIWPRVVGAETVLFAFDDGAFPFQTGTKMQLVGYHQPLGDGVTVDNLAVPPGKPGSPDASGTNYYPGSVCEVNGELWMWYNGLGDKDITRHPRLCLAKSKDGYHWEKPNLGLVEYGGNKDNNLVALGSSVAACIVFFEPDCPEASRRFKMVFEGKFGLFISVAYSADGFTWVESPHNPKTHVKFEPAGGVKWKGAYYITGQGGVNWAPDGWRNLVTHMSYDFENWTELTALGFRRDALPPRPATSRGGTDGEQVHLGAALWNRGNVILGFYGQWHGNPNNDLRWVSIDTGFIISHDALHYTEPIPDFRMIEAAGSVPWFGPYAKAIPISRAPAVAQGQGFANVGNQTLFWFSLWGAPDQGIRVAHWERDRLGYLQPFVSRKNQASVISSPLSNGGRPATISLNVSGLDESNGLKVTLLDEQFHELQGYTAQLCTGPEKSGLRQRVTWGAKDQITTDQSIRVRIDFSGPSAQEIRLYAVYVDSAP